MSDEEMNENVCRLFREEGLKFLNTVIPMLFGHEEGLRVSYTVGQNTTVYRIECDKKDFSRLLGTGGSTIKCLRRIVNVITSSAGVRSIIDIPYFPRKEDSK